MARADYARIGDGALPEAAVNLGPDVMLKEEETGTLPRDVVRAKTLQASCHGVEENLTLLWELTDVKFISDLSLSGGAGLSSKDRSLTGERLKTLHSEGFGPAKHTAVENYNKGISLLAGQSAAVAEVTADISSYTAAGYHKLTGICGVAPNQKRLDTHGFNIDFEIADIHWSVLADGQSVAEETATMRAGGQSISVIVGDAKTLTLRIALERNGFFKDTVFDFCDLKLHKA